MIFDDAVTPWAAALDDLRLHPRTTWPPPAPREHRIHAQEAEKKRYIVDLKVMGGS